MGRLDGRRQCCENEEGDVGSVKGVVMNLVLIFFKCWVYCKSALKHIIKWIIFIYKSI